MRRSLHSASKNCQTTMPKKRYIPHSSRSQSPSTAIVLGYHSDWQTISAAVNVSLPMKNRWFSLILSLALLLSGCGTLANLDGSTGFMSLPGQRPSRMYGGVRNEIDGLMSIDGLVWGEHSLPPAELPFVAVGATLTLADIPVSFVADTLTLPIVLQQQRTQSFSPIIDIPFPEPSSVAPAE